MDSSSPIIHEDDTKPVKPIVSIDLTLSPNPKPPKLKNPVSPQILITRTLTSIGIGVSTESDGTMNEDSPVGVTSVIQDFTTTDGNVPDKSSYVNVTSKPSGKKVNFYNLFTPGDNGIDVVVLVESIRVISERFANTTYGFFLGKRVAYPIVANYVRNTWGKYGLVRLMFSSSIGLFSFQFSSIDGLDAMLENGPWFIQNNPLILKKWHPDVNLLKEDVSTVLVWGKLHGVPVTAFSEDGLSVIATKLGGGETKNLKKTSQAPKSILVGVDSTNKVSDSNPFEVLNSVDNDVEMGTNGGTSNLDNNEANSSGSSFWNVENSSTSTTHVMDKIRKFENLVIDGQAILVDKAGNPLKKVEYPGDHDSEDEVTSIDNDMARDLASERTRFSTQSQDLSEEIQSICDKLDIRVVKVFKNEPLDENEPVYDVEPISQAKPISLNTKMKKYINKSNECLKKESDSVKVVGVVIENGDFEEQKDWLLVGRNAITGLSTTKGRKLEDNEIPPNGPSPRVNGCKYAKEDKGHSGKTNIITAEKISVLTRGFWCIIPTTWGKGCKKQFLMIKEVHNGMMIPLDSQGKLIQKLLLKQEVYGLLSSCLLQYFSYKENEVFQDMHLIQKLRDDQKCMKKVEHSSRSKATKDIISIGSFVEVLVLNHYVLVGKILRPPCEELCGSFSSLVKSKMTTLSSS
ncbi:beta-caryophyllene synthase [Tanacetum coccineum]|uniref:Beta-caryophyllene synthase n=1 Tax=Tanacetum coccineum TaxID=301880 RepID=A0ABQ5CNL0_9ASTR